VKLLAIEARQWGTYLMPRYEHMEKHGFQVYLLAGEGTPDTWPLHKHRSLGSKTLADMTAAAKAWHAEEQFDGVFTLSEMGVIVTAHIARELGLPGISVEAALASRNKYLMRQAHERGNVPHPKFRYVQTQAEALAAAAEFGYPAIVKPTLGGASGFVFRCDTPEDLALRYEQAARGILDDKFYPAMEADGMELGPNGLLVESFLDGHEHLIEAVVWDGEVYLGSVVDRVTVEGDTFDDDVHHAPTSLSPEKYAQLYEVAAGAVRAQGLERSVAHVEIRFHQGEPYILEAAARPGGGGLNTMSEVIGDYDPIVAVADIAVGRKPRVGHFKPTGVHCSGVAMICPAGVIEDVIVPPELYADPDVAFFRIIVKPGDVIKRPPDGNTVFGFLGMKGDSFEDVMSKMNDFMAKIDVRLVGKTPAGSAPG
jgi:biotin carboxylase